MFLIGIAGGSGSGKTTFARKVLSRVRKEHASQVALLPLDMFYLDQIPSRLLVHGEPNFDHPGAFDWNLLREQLSRLKAGGTAELPVYDFKTSHRTSKVEHVGPCKVVLLEGIYALWEPAIRALFDVKVYLHVDADIRFIRRLHRDVRERGRSLDSIIRQYYDTVRPMHHEFLEPTRQFADIVVGEETDIAADVLAARVAELVYGIHSDLGSEVRA